MENLTDLLTTAAAAAWLTKSVVDLARQRIESLNGNAVLALAVVLGLVFNLAWTLYQKEPFVDTSDYARVFIQGVLSALGSVVSTETQKAVPVVRRAVNEKEEES